MTDRRRESSRRGSSRVTIADVAREAGVSTQTVSRVVNRRPDVAAATRAEVEQVIRQLGYHPSAAAQSLASHRSRTLGVAVVGLEYVGTAQTLSGIISASSAAGFTVLVNEIRSANEQPTDELIAPLLQRQVEGVIFCGPDVGGSFAKVETAFRSHSIPLIFAHSSTAAEGRAAVTIDNALGSESAAEHLVANGARTIAHIAGPMDWVEAVERRDGWRRAMQHHQLDASDDLLVEGDWGPASGAAALDELLRRVAHVDAIAVANDQMALGVLHRAHQVGIQVPAQLLVTGFDDIVEAAWTTPSLTTVRQPLFDAGCAAISLALRAIDDAESDHEITLPTTLIVRESSCNATTLAT